MKKFYEMQVINITKEPNFLEGRKSFVRIQIKCLISVNVGVFMNVGVFINKDYWAQVQVQVQQRAQLNVQ